MLFHYAISFNFYQPVLLDQSFALHERASRADIVENFSVGASHLLPVCNIGQENSCADDIEHLSAAVFYCFPDNFQAVFGLIIRIAREGWLCVVADRGGA